MNTLFISASSDWMLLSSRPTIQVKRSANPHRVIDLTTSNTNWSLAIESWTSVGKTLIGLQPQKDASQPSTASFTFHFDEDNRC